MAMRKDGDVSVDRTHAGDDAVGACTDISR
jgi:hypothetical protein